MSIYLLVASLLWSLLGLSLALSAVALVRNAWRLMALAAVLSFLFSFAALLSIGPFVFLVTCLQIAAAVALARHANGRGWSVAIGSALLVWSLLVVVPLARFWFA